MGNDIGCVAGYEKDFEVGIAISESFGQLATVHPPSEFPSASFRLRKFLTVCTLITEWLSRIPPNADSSSCLIPAVPHRTTPREIIRFL